MGTSENRRTDNGQLHQNQNQNLHLNYQSAPPPTTTSASFSSSQAHHPAVMNHFATPIMRFKAAHGYARPKVDESADPACNSPRLPSLAGFPPGPPPLSPLNRWATTTQSPRGEAFPSPRDSFSEGFPSPRFGAPLSNDNRAGFSPTAASGFHQQPFTLAPLRRSNEAVQSGSLPSLVALAASLPDKSGSRLSPSRDAVCGPFPYERAHSCPSDELRSFHATERFYAPEPAATPLYILKSSVPRTNIVRSVSVDAESATELRPRSLMVPLGPHSPLPEQPWQHSEPEAIQRWLEPLVRQSFSLKSLAESAHQMQLLERSRSPSVSSGPSSPMSTTQYGASEEEEMLFHADSKREKKLCSFPQCASNAVTRGKCISHGGGRRCQRKGCTRGAQSKGLCVAHGGGRICRERGCSNIQRSMGLCIRHGGGKRCSMPGCQKGVVRQDLCTAHGGKRKCRVEECTKHVKKRGLCRSHANALFAPSG